MKLPAPARELSVFVAVGLAATVCNYVVAVATQRLTGANAYTSGLVGYLASVAISYFGNSLFTFRRPALHGPQFAKFAVVSLAGLAVNLGLVFAGTAWARWPLWMAEIPVVIVVPAATFTLSKVWAFKAPA